ncbi:amino acid ABC transporter ATP-binding protein [Bradyrhizobium sp. LA7.1]|uniref:amino acid ABC transporter ATP-binding protein n=1 Tax=Bradyrhizobium sp. LA7.1 TaxID=3156324 RepID=UPI00339543C5
MSYMAIRDVSKYYSATKVLDGVSLDIQPGEVVALIGRSGSGKSTLLRCVNGLEPIDDGDIKINGRSVRDGAAAIRDIRREVGMVFQSFNLFPHLTVGENVMLAPTVLKLQTRTEAREIAKEVLARVGLADKFAAYPATLSGGQQQRVAIARCLAMSPKALLLDEITSALDPELVGEVVQVLEKLAGQGMTMLLVTHEMGFARRAASRMLFMNKGRIWESGAPEVLLREPQTDEMRHFVSSMRH